MTKKEVHMELRRSCGSDFATISAIARALGKSREYVRDQITADLEYIGSDEPGCRSKRYFLGDVAQKIMEVKH